MQLFYQRFNVQEYLLFLLLGITSVILVANFVGPSVAENVTDGFSIILSSIVMILSFFMVSKYGIQGNHGKSWILFMLFSTYWFCAETVDILYYLVVGEEVWDYADDFFYITGYQLLFASLVFYLKPFVSQISKKLVCIISISSLSLLIPSMMTLANLESHFNTENMAVLLSYPILDSLVLIPALIGVILFFRGGVNFMISLLCLGIISQIIGDNSILFLTIQNTYHSGHLADTLFLWTYALFSFALANQFMLMRSNSEKNTCPACGKSCTGHN